MKGVVSNFAKLYDAPFFPFRSLSERAIDLGLTAVTSMTGEQYLAANNASDSHFLIAALLTTSRLEPRSLLISFKLQHVSIMGKISI